MKAQPPNGGLAIDTNLLPSEDAPEAGWSPGMEWNLDPNLVLSARSNFSAGSQRGLYTALSPMGFEWSPQAIAGVAAAMSSSKRSEQQHFFPSTGDDNPRFSLGSAADMQEGFAEPLFNSLGEQEGVTAIDDEMLQQLQKRRSAEFDLPGIESGGVNLFLSPNGRTSPSMYHIMLDRLSPRGQEFGITSVDALKIKNPSSTLKPDISQSFAGTVGPSVTPRPQVRKKRTTKPRSAVKRKSSSLKRGELPTEFNIVEQVKKLRTMRPQKRKWYVKVLARKAYRLGLGDEFETQMNLQQPFAHDQHAQLPNQSAQLEKCDGPIKPLETAESHLDQLCMTPPPRVQGSNLRTAEMAKSTSSPPAPANKRISFQNEQIANALEEVNLASSEYLRKSLQYRFQTQGHRGPPHFRSPDKTTSRGWKAPLDKRVILS